MPDIRKILEGAGFKVDSVDRIRLARGVGGKSSHVAAAAYLVLAATAFRVEGVPLFAAVIAATVVIFLAYFIGILWFATKNPGLALLEGAELIQWRQMDLGMKGVTTLPDGTNTEPPLLIEESGEQ